ncbi:hypothetical protein VFPBJ_00062 [Purpureocillium lilacinum]|uniref:Uncharacterized protein n=1 Tax=Purpureocillium lilacinum TaxID=33203 RepID=A0A179H7Z8_PURLI|nr:hypothetical protein VFPBJ_00062 [Purpureocillium lilacinum]
MSQILTSARPGCVLGFRACQVQMLVKCIVVWGRLQSGNLVLVRCMWYYPSRRGSGHGLC